MNSSLSFFRFWLCLASGIAVALFASSGLSLDHATPQLPLCAQYILDFFSAHSPEQNTGGYFPYVFNPDKSVTIEKTSAPGRHGGKILTITRTGSLWPSKYMSMQFDPQGDPRWIIEVLGSARAEYLGFKIIDDKTATIPNAVELINGLKKIDQALRKQGSSLTVQFAQQAPSKSPLTKYLSDFLASRTLPLADLNRNENHYLHDISFHITAIFFPAAIMDQLAVRIHFHLKFFEYLRAKYQLVPSKLNSLKLYQKDLHLRLAKIVDDSTGYLTPYLIELGLATLNPESLLAGASDMDKQTIFTMTGDLKETRLESYRNFWRNYFDNAGEPTKEVPDRALQAAMAELAPEEIDLEIALFESLHRGQLELSFDDKPNVHLDEICRQILENLGRVKAVIAELQKVGN